MARRGRAKRSRRTSQVVESETGVLVAGDGVSPLWLPVDPKPRAHRMGVSEDEGVDLAEVLPGPPLHGAGVERLAALRGVPRPLSSLCSFAESSGQTDVDQDGLFGGGRLLRARRWLVLDAEDRARVPADVLLPERILLVQRRAATLAARVGRGQARDGRQRPGGARALRTCSSAIWSLELRGQRDLRGRGSRSRAASPAGDKGCSCS